MLKKAQSLFVKVVDGIEGHSASPIRYFQLFFAILSVRLCLEFFSTQRLFSLDDVLHIGLWFVFIVLAFMVQLRLFSGVPMARVARLVVVCFTIALTAPIIDLILRGGMGSKMNYLAINSWGDVWKAYLTVGGASLSRGATLGIRVEIVLLVIASFNYVRTKTGSIQRAIVGAWSIYTVLFLSGTVPRLLGWIVDTWQLTYLPNDRSTVLFLLCLDLALLLVIFVLHAPRRMVRLLQAVPWVATIAGLVSYGIGACLAMEAYPDNWGLNPTTLFWFPMLVGLAWTLACFAGLPNALERGSVSLATSSYLRTGLLILTAMIALAISERVFFAAMVVWGALFLLNEQPLQLRNVPLLRNLLHAMVIVAVALVGFATFGGPMIGFPTAWIVGMLAVGFVGSVGMELTRQR